MGQIVANSKFNENLSSKVVWMIFLTLLFLLFAYGLSFFFVKPKIETVTTPPTVSNSYINQTQDVDFHNKHAKKH